MKTFSTRVLKLTIIVVLSVLLLLSVGGKIVSYYATRQLKEKLKQAGGNFEDLNFSILAQSIQVKKFEIPLSNLDRSAQNRLAVGNITFNNVSLFAFLVHERLDIDEVVLANGTLQLNKNRTDRDTSASPPSDSPIDGINVNKLIVKNVKTTVSNDSATQWSATLNFTVSGLKSTAGHLSDPKHYHVEAVEATIKDIVINDKKGLYQFTIDALHVNSLENELTADSILVVPQFPKFKFSRAAGKQVDRLNMFIKKINVHGIQYNQLQDSVVVASRIHITSGEVYSFRDKRMPFREKENKPLPMEAIKRLPIAVEIDTIQLSDCKVTYEEFPSEGFNSGKVIFDRLEATFTGVRNRPYYNKPNVALLTARANLMGSGLIQATFTLPLDDDKRYHAEGKITGLNLPHLNPALENLAFIRIESGNLNELAFKFNYDNQTSDGTITVNYEDLKIKGLKKDKIAAVNDLKTFLINTVIKNDKDHTVPTENRRGTISFERDKKRQIFNYWWKSLHTGIKSSVLESGK